MHVILYHHLQSEHGVPESGDHKRHQQHRIPWLGHGSASICVISVQQAEHQNHEPDGEHNQCHRSNPLGPPMACT
jgi:hypothetical protein